MSRKRGLKYYEQYRSYRKKNRQGNSFLNLSLSYRIIISALILLIAIIPVILKDTWIGSNRAYLEKVFLTHLSFDEVREVAGKIFTNEDNAQPVVKDEDSYTLNEIPPISQPVIGQLSEDSTSQDSVVITAPEGYPVVAVLNGKVKAVRQSGQNMEVEIDHGKGLTTVYTYLKAVGIKPEDEVQKGTIIGYTGKVNNSSGVSFSVRLDGEPVNTKNLITGK